MQMLKNFKKFVDEILLSNSRNYKVEVVKKYANDEDVKYCLWYIFNIYVRTGISRKKLAKDVRPVYTCKSSKELLEYLKENNTGRDIDVSLVKGFEEGLGSELKELLEGIICKNLKLGIETPTINEYMGGIIPVFSIMLANKYFDDPSVVEGKEFTLTTKIDGGRIIAIKNEYGDVNFYTRAGQIYEGLVDLENEMKKLPNGIMLDGEITLVDTEGLDNKAQYKQTMMITRRLGEKHGVKMKVFDMMSSVAFKMKIKACTYEERRMALEEIFRAFDLKYFELLPVLYSGTDTSMIKKVLDEQVAKGEEGIMININDEPYSFTRNNALLKVKKMKDLDLKVVGFEEGSGVNEGSLGAFLVEYKGCIVRVGSGIEKSIREQVWANKDEYLGITITVQYFEETTNQAGGVSLRFPVFVDFRYDK